MKLKSAVHQALWYLTRSLVYAKRSIVFVFSGFGRGFSIFLSWYRRTLGFAFFKARFYAKRRFFSEARRSRSPWHWFGERWILQVIGFGIGFVIVFPQTSFYRPDFGQVAGQDTLLYALVGPGEQDFAPNDDVIEETALFLPSDAERWREGALIAQPQSGSPVDSNAENELTGTTIGGSIIKPVLVSINNQTGTVPADIENKTPGQPLVAEYRVQPGDVIGSIAQRYGLTVQTILTANRLTARSLIRPGDVLKIPAADGVLHTVAKGETITKIAKLYGVQSDEILKINGGAEKNLKVGTQILVPGAQKMIQTATPIAKNNRPLQIKIPSIPNLPIPISSGGYVWPSGARIITQYYGLRHTGVDIAGSIGLPNYAARAGRVIKSQGGWNGGYGNYIIIDHGDGVQTLYAHNSKLLVSPGEYVAQGQVIGLLGSTGRSTGPHLHFEIRINGRRGNPLQFVRR